LDAAAFLEYFTDLEMPNDATIVSLEGRMFPVEVAYLQEPTPDYVRTAAEISWNINLQVSRMRHVHPVLIFFPRKNPEIYSYFSQVVMKSKGAWKRSWK